MCSEVEQEPAPRQTPDNDNWEMQFDRESIKPADEPWIPTRPLEG